MHSIPYKELYALPGLQKNSVTVKVTLFLIVRYIMFGFASEMRLPA